MMGLIYLSCLILASACMLLIDYRFRLFFWADAATATLVTLGGLFFLLMWDAAGIVQGVFFRGDSVIASGVMIAPEMPVEEPVFLLFLVLCTMTLFTGAERALTRKLKRP